MTCNKYIKSAEEAKIRLEKYGFKNVKFIFGNENRNDVFFKNRNFTAACEFIVENNLKHCLLFEEDVILKGSLKIFDKVYKWCINHTSLWDIVNFGGISITPVLFIHPHLGYARCVLGSSILVSFKYAQQFLKQVKEHGLHLPFDTYFAQTCVKQLKCSPSIFTQHTSPTGSEFLKIEPFFILHEILDHLSTGSSYLILLGSIFLILSKSLKNLFYFWCLAFIGIILVLDFAQHFEAYKLLLK